MQKPVIAFITGGFSGEAEISYASAKTIQSNIDTNQFEYVTIDIRKDGWWYVNEDNKACQVDKNDFSIQRGNQKVLFDAALIGIHGTPGEDGKLQGYLDMVGVPYTTCDHTSSALTFNKRFTVAVAALSGIRVAKSLHLFKQEAIDIERMSEELQFPVFVKPANGGSSIGMSKVPAVTELPAAITKAFLEDNQILIEEFIEGREFTIGVFKKEQDIITLPITEVISHNYFFDFEAKYQGKNEKITPAVLESNQATKIKQAATKIYQIFNCEGIIRIDFIYNEIQDEPFMLEVNTVPGQSASSIVPTQVLQYGMTLMEFYSSLIHSALRKKGN